MTLGGGAGIMAASLTHVISTLYSTIAFVSCENCIEVSHGVLGVLTHKHSTAELFSG